jgi:hypothetical protein
MTQETILGIAIFFLIVAFGIILGGFLKRQMNGEGVTQKNGKFEGSVKVRLNSQYLHHDAFKFFNILNRSIPAEYVAFPKVGVDNIVDPAGNLIAYKAIGGQYVDFCIFKRTTMKPVAVVDLIDPRIGTTPIKKQDGAVTKSLEAINMPVLEFNVQNNDYNQKEILAKFLDSQDLYSLTELRKQREEKANNSRHR